MNEKRVRYITTIFTLDNPNNCTTITSWDKMDNASLLNNHEKYYGYKLNKSLEMLSITVEYLNIIWNYHIYFCSYKKFLISDDDGWNKLEKQIIEDLKMIGQEELKDKVTNSLKENKCFEYKTKIEKQFKQYCV